jgi:hydroxymethylglutaryl-CoA reductase (NADPH)
MHGQEVKMNKEINIEALLQKLVKGEIRPYDLEQYADFEVATVIRRKFVEMSSATSVENIGKYVFRGSEVGGNIENLIGAVPVPLGYAGPLKVKGRYADGYFYVPLSTTEGALVASINRGCRAITLSDGASVAILKDEMTRAVAFSVKNISYVQEIINWIKDPKNFSKMQRKVSETTKHGELMSVQPFVVGRHIYLRFAFDTKDAMGMNMATIASDSISRFIQNKLGLEPVILSGNMCTDKKPSAINNILGRGKTVIAEVCLPEKIIREVLKTDSRRMFEVSYVKNMLGSAKAGSMGFNTQVANVAAAVYLACGQDMAHVVEASSGAITSIELTSDESLYCSVTLPAIQVGTIGGGTKLPAQQDCLKILGVAGSGNPPGVNSKKFAEIIGAAILAGEISEIAALASGDLAKAHKKYGRKK